MKKILSFILAIAMVISIAPSVFADDTATESTKPADVVYDFTSYTDGWQKLLYNSTNLSTIPSGLSYTETTIGSSTYYVVEPSGKNFSFAYQSGAYDWKRGYLDGVSGGCTRVVVTTGWAEAANRQNKVGVKVTVDETGWYSPSFTGGLNNLNFKASIYLDTTYLGDYDFSYSGETETSAEKFVTGAEKKLNAVYLEEGEHILWFGIREGTYGSLPGFVNFKLTGLSAKPEITGITSEVPDGIMSIGDSKEIPVQVVTSEGNALNFGEYTIDSNGTKSGSDEENYLEITSDNDGVVKVTSYSKGGLCNSENTNYSIEAVGGGVANLVYTPYIDGEAQTSYTKQISVAGPITVDFSKTTDKGTSTPGYTISTSGQAAANWRKPTTDMVYVPVAGTTAKMWGEGGGTSTKIALVVDVPEAGFYKVKLWGGLTIAGGIMSMYANGNYAGDYNFYENDTATTNVYGKAGTEKALNTVYLSEGDNLILFGLRKSFSTYYDTRIFLKKITLTPVESLDGKTAIEISKVASDDIPETMTVGYAKDATATVTMEDDSVRSFAAYASDAKADTTDSVTVTSSAPEIISVESCDDDALGASDKTTFTLQANKAGSADITVTAKVGDSEKTETYTVTVEDNEKDNYIALGVANNVNGAIKIKGTDYTRGTEVTVTAEEFAGKVFRHWVIGTEENGTVVSTSESYTFNLMTNTYLTAVYTDEQAAGTKIVEFFNWNGDYLGQTTVENGAVTVPETIVPSLIGFSFDDRWLVDEDTYLDTLAEFDDVTRAVAVFTAASSYDVGGTTYDYDEEVTEKADAEMAWYRDGVLVAYGTEYTYNVWDAVGEITSKAFTVKKPIVVLDDGIKDGNACMIEYDNGGKTVKEVGILFGDSDATVDSADSKATSQRNEAHGQFTAKPRTNGTAGYARGYIIYEDGEDYKVIYTDAIALS